MLITFINASDYMSVLTPERSTYMVENGLLSEAEVRCMFMSRLNHRKHESSQARDLKLRSGSWKPSESSDVSHSGAFKMQQVLSLFMDAKAAGVPCVGNWSPHIQMKTLAMAEALIQVEGHEDGAPVHKSMQLLCWF